MAGRESLERNEVLGAYKKADGSIPASWAKKVAAMSDQQVFAVYARLKKQNKI